MAAASASAAGDMKVPLVAVCGATGQQGGSVVDWLLRAKAADGSPSFRVRGLTRNATAEKAKALASRGVEVVACDQSKPDTLGPAFKGATYVFGLTNFWDPEMKKPSPATDALAAKYGGPATNPFYIAALNEELQGKAIYDNAIQQGVQMVLWSTLPDAEVVSKQKFKVYHFTMKAHVDAYAKSLKDKIGSIFLYPGMYAPFLASFAAPKDDATGGGMTFSSALSPTTLLPLFDPADTGYYAATVLMNPQAWNQKIVYMVGSCLTVDQIATIVTKVTGKPTKHQQLPWDKFQVPYNSPELLEMFKFFDECSFFDMNLAFECSRNFPCSTSYEACLLKMELAKVKVPPAAQGAAAAASGH